MSCLRNIKRTIAASLCRHSLRHRCSIGGAGKRTPVRLGLGGKGGLPATWLFEDVDFAIVLRKAASSLTRVRTLRLRAFFHEVRQLGRRSFAVTPARSPSRCDPQRISGFSEPSLSLL